MRGEKIKKYVSDDNLMYFGFSSERLAEDCDTVFCIECATMFCIECDEWLCIIMFRVDGITCWYLLVEKALMVV